MEHLPHRPAILAIGTAVPVHKASQSEIAEWMAASFVDRPELARLIRILCAHSEIGTRHSCAAEYHLPPQECRLAPGVPLDRSPSTAERMAIYEREAAPLGAAAARQALASHAAKSALSVEMLAGRVTHLVVATCTGFFAPGLDFVLAQTLKLAPTVERTLIGFMGCSAMFNCLRTANQIIRADPTSLVLVVSVELCSLHTQPDPLRDQLVAASIFADGASACLVGVPDHTVGDYFTLERFHTSMKPDTESEMVWQVGNHGFSLRLSPRVPDHLAEAAPATLAALFDGTRPQFWAIHPGGNAIVDGLATRFGLDEMQVAASRAVLRDYGNLSSATILFVLADLQRRFVAQAEMQTEEPGVTPVSSRLEGVAMAFGPGLVIEMARLGYVPPVRPALVQHQQPVHALQLAEI